MSSEFPLRHGIYESIVTRALQMRLSGLPESCEVALDALDAAESSLCLALHLSKLIASSLSLIKGEDRRRRQAGLCNQLLEVLSCHDTSLAVDSERIVEEVMCLLQVQDRSRRRLIRPGTPLSQAALFTGTSCDLTLESELKKEIQTADAIDVLCSFIKWSGLRLLLPSLQEAAADGKRLRFITTSYLGATDLKAVDALYALPGVELLVSYDTRRTRLHAKSYIFHRDNGFGTAYVGSSNISDPALTSGLEWNLKISQFELPYLWEKVCATFATYQNTSEFARYEANSRDRLARALRQEAIGNRNSDPDGDSAMALMDITPYPYQEEILDKVRAERELHQRCRNLVVAATGTGKTVLAAFDFLRLRPSLPRKTFLFVAHREEILRQSRSTFRQILRDQNFGELLVGSNRPSEWSQLFASIQSLNSNRLCDLLQHDYYDYIVVDEFHHAAAASYRRLLEYFQPRVLLGLTATPERHDGLDVLQFFDGRIAAEIRLPDAITRKLLTPFQYFGISDCVDLSQVRWSNGGYDRAQLDNIFNGNTQRADLVITKMREILLDVQRCRCLCFCVSQAHAEFMNGYFNRQGVKSAVLTAGSSGMDRRMVQKRLEEREINVICVVDLYNEGVDIPSIDTALFLRPTESLTVFLQQLGRGLRVFKKWNEAIQDYEYKECLTVLDFVGNAHRNFNFEQRFRALLGMSGQPVADEVEQGFPHLPAGCHIQLEKQARQHILENIRNSIAHARQAQLVGRIAAFADESGQELTLANFLNYHHLPLRAAHERGLFARLCQQARLRSDFTAPDEDRLRKGLLRIGHLNSVGQLGTLRQILRGPAECLEHLTESETRLLTMLHFSLWGAASSMTTLSESVERLRANGPFWEELLAVLDWLYEQTDLVTAPPELPFVCPLELHANYTRDEILAGLGCWRLGVTPAVREGVKYLPEINTDVFLVTLNKSEKHYSPTTMYLDYAISDDLFHWQSQSTTSIESPTGQRYVSGGGTVLLFVRENKQEAGLASSYCFLGPADYVSHRGSRPISMEWRLRSKMPARLCRVTERMAIA